MRVQHRDTATVTFGDKIKEVRRQLQAGSSVVHGLFAGVWVHSYLSSSARSGHWATRADAEVAVLCGAAIPIRPVKWAFPKGVGRQFASLLLSSATTFFDCGFVTWPICFKLGGAARLTYGGGSCFLQLSWILRSQGNFHQDSHVG